MNKFLKLSFVLLFPYFVSAQDFKVEALLDTNSILIGDQVNLRLLISKPISSKVNFPVLKDTIVKNLEIVTYGTLDTLDFSGNQVTLKQDYLLTSFDSAVYFLPSFPFTISIDTLTDTLFTNPLVLGVNTLQVDTTKQAIFDIKKPYDAPWSFIEFLREYGWYILAGILFIGIVLFIIFYLIPKLRKKTVPQIKIFEKPKEPAHLIAIRELDILKSEKLWQNNKIKEYHTRLTEIIRRYLEHRFEIMALEQTSDEVLQQYSRLGNIDTKTYSGLRQMLVLADFVKFAKAHPLPDENDMSMRNAYLFVDLTKEEKVQSDNESVNIENKEEGSVNV
ncbi:MAG: hypothetical protein ABIJ97_11955 [Bacteroidota bacterium]